MKQQKLRFKILLLSLCLGFNSSLLSQPALSTQQKLLLEVAAGIHFTFKHCAPHIWTGYDLSRQPFVLYLPGELALYLNTAQAPDEFEPYPQEWPKIGARAYIHYGPYRDLSGQFVFDFTIDSLKTFAMGLPDNLIFSSENPPYILLSTTIHEGFHQYQRHHFGEIPWAREERYPILDVKNTALASLELLILRDALQPLFAENQGEIDTKLKEFLAVREQRWKDGPDYIRTYEQGQEINEGTAKYVEMKALACFLKLDTTAIRNPLFRGVKRKLSGMTVQKLLLKEIQSRLSGFAVAPDDMSRNRIYAVGAAMGFLLDRLQLDWKEKFQSAGPDVSFPGLLKAFFSLSSEQLASYFSQAQADYVYQKIFANAKEHTDQYLSGFRQALEQFNSQPGIRIEIEVPNNGLLRFRSSLDKKWMVDQGQKLLCLHYNMYSLKSMISNNLRFETHDKAIFEQNEWHKRRKTVVFFSVEIDSLNLDGEAVAKLTSHLDRPFKKIKMAGKGFHFSAQAPGRLRYQSGKMTIILD